MERTNDYIIGQQLKQEDRDFVDMVYERLRIWKDGCTEMHERAKVARKILLLQDPYQDPANTPREQRTLQLQTLKSTFNNCVADQIDNVMEAKMIPETLQAQSITDDINDIVRYIYEVNEYQAMHRMRVQDYLCTGTAVTQIMWDEDAANGDGDVAFIRVPVENFLYDPAEANIQEARALMKIDWHPLSWYKEHYPEEGKYVMSDEHTADAVGEQENQEELAADEPKAMLVEYWWRTYDAKRKKYKINMARLAGRVLLEKCEDLYEHGMYPFVVDVFTEIEGIPVGEGLVMELAPMMRYINRYAHYMDINIRYSSKARLLVNRSAGVDPEQLADLNQDIVECDRTSEDNIRFLESPQLTTLALNQMMQMQTDLKQDSGQNQFTRGETAGGVTAATAIVSLQEAGGKQTRMRTETLKRGFKRITEQVLWLVSQYYDEGRKVLITGENTEPREVDASPSRIMGKKSKGAIPPPPYTVRIQVERLNPNAISELNQLFIDVYKMSAEAGQSFPLSALFSIMNIEGKDKILPIIQSVEQTTQIMQQLSEQNQMLQQQVAEQQESINGLKDTLIKQAQNTVSTSSSKNPEAYTAGLPAPTM